MVIESPQILGTAAFIDAEHALDPVYSTKLGVNLEELLICQVSQPVILFYFISLAENRHGNVAYISRTREKWHWTW